jgi:hypothetical protein
MSPENRRDAAFRSGFPGRREATRQSKRWRVAGLHLEGIV